MAAFVCILLCSNLIGPAKATTVHLPWIGDVTFLAGVLFFPISYFFGDIFTEVYGYGCDRRVVWAGFGALAFASLMAATVVALPPAVDWVDRQHAVESIFGSTPRIIAGSITAFWCGSFVNSYVLAKLKVVTAGRWLWTRTIGSTICGEAVDSALFYTIAFVGQLPMHELIGLAITQYVLKVMWEVLSTPLTYRLVTWLKRAENEDYFDQNTDFTPFTLKI
jgi:uncharacterized integral membrane protein (TIGR00697 family)